MKYASVVLFAGSVMVTSLFGLGCNPAATINEKIGQTVAEKMVNNATGGNAKVDIDDGKVTIKDEKTGSSMAFGEDVKIPDSFPKDVLMYPGAKAVAVLTGSEDSKQGASITLQSKDAAKDIVAWYEAKMKDAGWETKQSLSMSGTEMRSFQSAKVMITLTVLPSGKDDVTSSITIVRSEEK